MFKTGYGRYLWGKERVSLRGLVDGAFVRTEDAAKLQVDDVERLVRLRDGD